MEGNNYCNIWEKNAQIVENYCHVHVPTPVRFEYLTITGSRVTVAYCTQHYEYGMAGRQRRKDTGHCLSYTEKSTKLPPEMRTPL